MTAPPHDLDAERALLGALALDPSTVALALDHDLDVGDFHAPRHGEAWAAAVDLHAGGHAIDPVTWAARVEGLDRSTVLDWGSSCPSTANVAEYVTTLKDFSARRQVIGVTAEAWHDARRGEKPVAEIADDLGRRVASIRVTGERPRRDQLHDGAVLLDQQDGPTALWGKGTEVVAASGESTIICAPQGLGKTTLAQQWARRRIGATTEPLLGMKVVPGKRRTLDLAMDRPSQSRRSMARMVTEDDREVLEDWLRIWQGPLPQTLDRDPTILAQLAADADADSIVVDSIKDTTPGCASDEMGAAINRAFQFCLADGVEVLALHHQRKAQQGGGKPKSLDDVYGSTWITSGAGSVVLLWGTPGDAFIDLHHLKSPQDPVGPLRLAIDFDAGTMDLADSVDLHELARRSATGLTAEGAARALYGKDTPDKNDVERARRKLKNHPDLTAHDGKTPPGGGKAVVYFRPREVTP